MRDFFKDLLKRLYVLSGIDQISKITDTQVCDLLDALVAECSRPEWSKIPPDVQKRVIEDAIKTDVDFYGLNVKFVRRHLNKFWDQNGLRILEKELATKPAEVIKRTPDELKRIDEIANEYLNQLANTEIKSPTRLSRRQILEEGGVRPQKIEYIPDPAQVHEHTARMRRFQEQVIRERHPELTDAEVQAKLNQLPI